MTNPDDVAWGLAGLYQDNHPGRLERPFDGTYLMVPPHLELVDDAIRWRWRENDQWLDPYRSVKPGSGILAQFIALADADPSAVLSYASRWGNLWLCPCTRPWSHRPVRVTSPGGLQPCEGPPPGDPYEWNTTEPLDAWYRYAHRTRAILRFVAAAARDEDASSAWSALLASGDGDSDIESWRHCWSSHVDECVPGVGRNYPASGACRSTSHEFCSCGLPLCYRPLLSDFEVGQVLDNLLADTEVRARCLWLVGDRPEFLIGREEGVLGEIALQLALVATRSNAIAFCSSCSAPYAPTRRPSTSRNNYCPGCRDRGRWAAAQRRRRAGGSSTRPEG